MVASILPECRCQSNHGLDQSPIRHKRHILLPGHGRMAEAPLQTFHDRLSLDAWTIYDGIYMKRGGTTSQFDRPIVRRLRKLCLTLPETSEMASWGHPNFRAGKRTFVAFEVFKGTPSIAFRLNPAHVALLLRRKQFFRYTVRSRPVGKSASRRNSGLEARYSACRSKLPDCCC